MQRGTLIGSIVVIVVLGGIIWYGLGHPLPSVSSSTSTVSFPVQGPYLETTPNYQIAANYPTSTPLVGSANDNALAAIKTFIASTITQFKSESSSAPGGNRPFTLQILYLIGSSAHTLSYIYTVNENTGGASGNTYFKTFVFDSTTGSLLALSDLFQPGTNYLSELATISQEKLLGIIGSGADQQMIANGAAPTEQDFQNFFFDNHNLDFLFPPSQVADAAVGPVTLPIPTSELTGLNPEYQ